MQNDPKFETLEELEAWVKERAAYGIKMLCGPTFSDADMDNLQNQFARVRAAHSHLMPKGNDDASI